MFRLPKSLVLAAAGAGLFTSFAGEGIACPPRGGGGYRPAYYQPQYYPQAYQQQCQPQPQITVHPQGQPVLTQQQQLQQQMLGQQFPQGQAQVGQGQVAQGQVGQGQVAQGQFGQQQVQGQFGQAGVQQQSVQQGQFAQPAQQQPAQGGAVQGSAVQGGAATSALNALGSGNVQGQPVQGQQIQSQQTQVQSQGVQQAQPAQPQQVQSAPAATADASTRSAADMALEALLGGGTQGTVAQEAAPAGAVPTGDFSASISNGTQVRLSLRNDNSFVWVASKGEKQSSFQGSFTLAGTALTLLRSDNQKLEGTLTQNAAGFQLKLAGQNDAGLSFVRAGTLASR